jgi:hypothetical protein
LNRTRASARLPDTDPATLQLPVQHQLPTQDHLPSWNQTTHLKAPWSIDTAGKEQGGLPAYHSHNGRYFLHTLILPNRARPRDYRASSLRRWQYHLQSSQNAHQAAKYTLLSRAVPRKELCAQRAYACRCRFPNSSTGIRMAAKLR